jgi:hypothetical protein
MEMKDVFDIVINEDDQLSTFLEQHKQRKSGENKKNSQDSKSSKKQLTEFHTIKDQT